MIPASIEAYEIQIRNMLCSRWSPERVVSQMQTSYGVSVPVQDVVEFLESIPEEYMLPVAKETLQERFKRLDLEIDATGEMARVLRMASERLGVALKLEDTVGERQPYVDTAMGNYWKMLREYVATRQTLGELPIAQKETKVQLDAGEATKALPSLKVLLLQQNNFGPPEEITIDGSYSERIDSGSGGSSAQLLSGRPGEDGMG